MARSRNSALACASEKCDFLTRNPEDLAFQARVKPGPEQRFTIVRTERPECLLDAVEQVLVESGSESRLGDEGYDTA